MLTMIGMENPSPLAVFRTSVSNYLHGSQTSIRRCSIRRAARPQFPYYSKNIASYYNPYMLIDVNSLQFCSAMMLLHRNTARFGSNTINNSQSMVDSRTICLEYAVRLSRILDDYRKFHGHACTVIGTALYNITMGAVVLIANRAEHASNSTFEHLACLTSCIRALEEIQVSYVSARTILKQLKYLMRRCKLLDLTADAQALRDANASLFQRKQSDVESPPINLAGQVLPTLSAFDETDQLDSGQFLMALEDCDALHTMGSWNDFDSIFT